VHRLFKDFKKAYDSVRREVFVQCSNRVCGIRLIKISFNKPYGKVHIGKHLSDSLPIQNSLKQGDALSPLL
jgi:hypothetical protein